MKNYFNNFIVCIHIGYIVEEVAGKPAKQEVPNQTTSSNQFSPSVL